MNAQSEICHNTITQSSERDAKQAPRESGDTACQTRPNLIFIMADQLRADFLSCYGADYVHTPHIDSLQERGVRYTQAYSLHPLCVPARVSLLTGRHALKTGVLDNGQFLRADYPQLGIRTWPELLVEQGYYTAAIGKMHFYPWDALFGFQYRAVAEDKRWIYIRDDYYHFLREHGYRKLHGNEHEGYYENRGAIVSKIPWEYSIDHFVGQEACRFIERYGEEGPFAMMVGFPGPHCPYDPCPEFLEEIDPEAMPKAVPEVVSNSSRLRQNNIAGNKRPWNGVDYTEFTDAHKRNIRAHYAALVRQIDHEVGQILNTLRAHGLLEDTILIFTSDHGDYLGDHSMIGKGSFFEASIHVPLLVHMPSFARSGVCEQQVCLTDIMPTLLHLAGCEIPSYVDAIPLLGLEIPTSRPRDYLIGATQGGWMIDDGEWRLCKYATGEHVLFHLPKDLHEQHNCYQDPACANIRNALDARLTQEIMRSIREANHDRRVYVRDLSQDPWFGREGWQRPYPRTLMDC